MPDVATVRLHEGITLDDLTDILKRLVDLQGCPACGLNGFDLHFGVDQETRFADLREQFRRQITDVQLAAPAEVGQVG